MSLRNTYFESNKIYEPLPIPEQPGYVPPSPPVPPVPEPGDTPVNNPPTYTSNVTCILYKNSDEPNKVSKSLSDAQQISIAIKDDLDVQHPVFTLSGNYSDFNYMYLKDKYYYVDCALLPGNLTEVIGKVDVLMTYNDQIRSHTAVIERNANVYNKYLNDVSFKTYAYKNTRTLKFPSGFSKTLNWLLITIGGASSNNGGE